MTDAVVPAEDPVLSLVLDGEIDLARVPELRELVERYRSSSAVNVAVDLGNVTFMDSSGLSFLANLHQIAMGRGGSVSVVHSSANLDRVIRLTGLDQILAVGATER